MKITATALSLNVDDPAASAEFARRHFGFTEEMSADGFVSPPRCAMFLRVAGVAAGSQDAIALPAMTGANVGFPGSWLTGRSEFGGRSFRTARRARR